MWKLQTFKLSNLKSHPKNPRKLSDEQGRHLKNSIEKFGAIEKPIVTKEGLVIGGHQRIKILKKLKVKEIECWVPDKDFTEKEIEELNIRLNKNTGEWDWDVLATQWEQTDLLQWGFELEELGFPSAEEIEGEVKEDSDVLEPCKDEDAITNLGDVYELNGHRLVCGDSTLPDVVSLCLNGNEPNLTMTDPPYGINMDKGFSGSVGFSGSGTPIKRRKYKDDWDSTRPTQDTFNYLICTSRLSIIWGGNFFADLLPRSTHWLVWDKKQTMPSFGDCELAWTNSERKSVKKYEVEFNGLIGKEKERFHPTQKPVQLFLMVMKDYSESKDKIFDPFLGSGTTLIAAEQLGRICYGIELSPAYCDIIVDRWKKLMIKNQKEYCIKLNGEVFNG